MKPLIVLLLAGCIHFNPIGADGKPCSATERFDAPDRCGTDGQRKAWAEALKNCAAKCQRDYPEVNLRDLNIDWDGAHCGCAPSDDPAILKAHRPKDSILK